jgi:hypothetical protein
VIEEALAHWGAVVPKTNKQTNHYPFFSKGPYEGKAVSVGK